jgi:hypothetical protein
VRAPAAGEAADVTVAAGEASAPVFVDSTGRRGRRIRFVFHLAGGAASVYAVLVVVAALLFTGPLDLLSLPAPGQTASAPAPARQNVPTPGQAGKRTTGLPGRSSPTPVAASASAEPSGSATAAPSPEATASAAPSASPSSPPAEPSPSAAPAAPPQSSAPAVTVVVVVGPA